jgi:hypothetical protein
MGRSRSRTSSSSPARTVKVGTELVL